MDNNELLMIVLAFVVGYMASGMVKNMCGYNLVEGISILRPRETCSLKSINTGADRCSNGYGYNFKNDTMDKLTKIGVCQNSKCTQIPIEDCKGSGDQDIVNACKRSRVSTE